MDAIQVDCERCNGTGRAAKEWDLLTRAPVAYGICTTCLGQGWMLVNRPASELVTSGAE
jgi:DnaJ-class molecular chaperone